MNLDQFRQIVDGTPDRISGLRSDLAELYKYVGLPAGSSLTLQKVREKLYERIASAFTSGHDLVQNMCRDFQTQLILESVIDGRPIDPYFLVLDAMKDGVRLKGHSVGPIDGNWSEAIGFAADCVGLKESNTASERERVYAREYAVAYAARRLQGVGFRFRRDGSAIYFEADSEEAFVAKLESLVANFGGLNLARRIFAQITTTYDATQERYHLVQQSSMSGGGTPKIPFGYLLQLAIKHLQGTKPLRDSDQNWQMLLHLATDYTTVLDVQRYVAPIFAPKDAAAALRILQETALYDNLFRLVQFRGSDVVPMLQGLLLDYDDAKPNGNGWTLRGVFMVIDALLKHTADWRGPVQFSVKSLAKHCPALGGEELAIILDELLCHPASGANQKFSKPADAPIRGELRDTQRGYDFFGRPLLHLGDRLVWIDRAVCASACIEAVFAAMRTIQTDFDGALGRRVERYLRAVLARHGVPTLSGEYVAGGEKGECDLVIETKEKVIFLECKKKALTRAARAGVDAHVLVDMANSMLAAQVQAGWHEVRLRKFDHLDLEDHGTQARLSLNGREVERIALTLLDYGSFQDRMVVTHFLEANLRASYTANRPDFEKEIKALNASLDKVREQLRILYPGQREVQRPFFHCWFFSVPELLVMLDTVTDPETFKAALWSTRHVVTGSSDLYVDLARARKTYGTNTR